MTSVREREKREEFKGKEYPDSYTLHPAHYLHTTYTLYMIMYALGVKRAGGLIEALQLLHQAIFEFVIEAAIRVDTWEGTRVLWHQGGEWM